MREIKPTESMLEQVKRDLDELDEIGQGAEGETQKIAGVKVRSGISAGKPVIYHPMYGVPNSTV